MSTTSTCPQCGAALPDDAPRGLCPRCLLCTGQAFALPELSSDGVTPDARGFSLPCSFANYELIEEIARGGMGVVFKARQKGLGRLVAVKMILAGRFASRGFLQRFQAEAAAIARLRHSHIVAVHEIGEVEGQPFFSMDFIDGRNLAQVIAQTGFSQISFDRVARWMRSIALSVEHAHQQGVLHRDLKPANILIDVNDEPHVTDFGLAKHFNTGPSGSVSNVGSIDAARSSRALERPVNASDGTSMDADLTLSGQVLGSPSYVPPEQAGGSRGELGPATDVYALGAILYHLLTGRPPFAAASLASTIAQVLQAEPIPPRRLNPSVPCDLETVCLKCLEKDPRRRYPTAREFADEIGRIQRNEPIVARPLGVMGRIWRWSRRQPALAGMTVAFAISLIAGFAGILWQLQRANQFARGQFLQRQRAEAVVNRLELERAEELFSGGDSPAALSYLAGVLRRDPAHPLAIERLLSALSCRNLALPISEPIQTTNQVNWVRFGPDETCVVLACFDGTAQVWDLRSGRLSARPMRHRERVRYAEFSPDGKRVVTASGDHTARVWDAATGEPLTPPLRHDHFVNTARFSPDGHWIVTASDGETVQIWNAHTGDPKPGSALRVGHSSLAAVFSPDGTKVFTGDRLGAVQFWDAQTGASVGPTISNAYEVRSTAFSPDGRRVAIGSYEGVVLVWDVESGRRVGELPKQEGTVQCVEFSPEGLCLLTAAGNSVRVWDALTWQPICEPIRHPSLVTSAQFSRDGRRLLISSYDTPVRLWDITPGKMLTTLVSGQGGVNDLAFSADGERLALGGAAWVQAWTVATRDKAGPRIALPVSSRQIQYCPDGRGVLVLMDGGICEGWDTETGIARFPSFGRGLVVKGSASPDGEHAVLEGRDETVSLVAGDGSMNTATIWNLRTAQRITPPLAHRNDILFCSFSTDGRWLGTASHDTTARVWDARTGRPVTPPLPHDRAVNRARFSPDGRWLVTASDDTTARVWDVLNGGRLHRRFNHNAAVNDAEFGPDSARVVTASADRTVRVWDIGLGRALTEPLAHARPVRSARFSPDGHVVATASDETVRLWDVDSGLAASEPLPHRGSVRGLGFSPDGRWLASISHQQTVHLREMPNPKGKAPDWLIELAEAFAGRNLDRATEDGGITWRRVLTLRQALLQSTLTDTFSRWGRWFFADRSTRTLSPSSSLTMAEYFRRRADEPFLVDIVEAMQVSRTNTVLLACLGIEARKWDSNRSPLQREVAERLTRHAYTATSNAPVVVRAHAEALYGNGQPAAALAMVERWLALAPGDPDAWELRGHIHAEARRWAEAWADLEKTIPVSTNRDLALLRTECFRRAFTDDLIVPSASEGKPLTLRACFQPSSEISWQWQHDGVDIPGATEAVLHFPSLARTNFGSYRVELRHPSGQTAILPTVLVHAPPAASTVTGQWDFEDGTLAATIGYDLEFFDGPHGETAKETRFGTTTELGLLDIDGRSARVMRFPVASPTMGYVLRHGALGNGGAKRVNQYTIIMDILIPNLNDPANAPMSSTWTALYQSNLRNKDDAELYLNWSNGRSRARLGVVGEYSGNTLVVTGQWNRIVVTVDLAAVKPVLSKYVNGHKHADQTILHDQSAGDPPEGFDGRFSLPPAILLFTENAWETSAGYINSIQFHNVKLTDAQIAALGGPSADGIPLTVPAPNAIPSR